VQSQLEFNLIQLAVLFENGDKRLNLPVQTLAIGIVFDREPICLISPVFDAKQHYGIVLAKVVQNEP